MMKAKKAPLGAWLSFEYLSAEGVWMPRTAIMRAKRDTKKNPLRFPREGLKRGRWMFLMFDISRGCERHFYACRMRNVRVVQVPAVYETHNEADAYAGGWERGLGGGFRAIPAARLTHGLPSTWAVIAVESQPVENRKSKKRKELAETA